MYENETLELKDVWQIFQYNELMKKRFDRGGLRIGSQEAEGKSLSRGPKKGTKDLVKRMIATTANSQGT